MAATLIRTDKNGTKYFEGMVKCPKCGGSGRLPEYSHVDGGICFECMGACWVYKAWKEMTPEYEAKLFERRAARAEKKRLAEFDVNAKDSLEQKGFSLEGKTYLFLNDTYAIKEKIKQLGGKFDYDLGWHIDHQVEGYNFAELDKEQVLEQDYWGKWNYKKDGREVRNVVQIAKKEAERQLAGTRASEYVGEIGKRIEVELTYIGSAMWDISYGYRINTTYLHKFHDAVGNLFIWKTTNPMEYIEKGVYKYFDEGAVIKIKGTVKEHKEYQGDKQTVLTRCKVV